MAQQMNAFLQAEFTHTHSPKEVSVSDASINLWFHSASEL